MLSFSAESFVFQFVIKKYKDIILPVVLYGCETWSLTLGEKRRLRVFENRVLRRILRPKRDEVTGEWRKLHNEELDDLYCSPSIIEVIKSRRLGLVGHVACKWERGGGCIQSFGREPEGKRKLGNPRHRWEYNIKMDLHEVGWRGMGWIELA